VDPDPARSRATWKTAIAPRRPLRAAAPSAEQLAHVKTEQLADVEALTLMNGVQPDARPIAVHPGARFLLESRRATWSSGQ
jgi:hypothetical protein